MPEPNTGCHFWIGSVGGGYGLVRYWKDGRRRRARATRMAWEFVHGVIPDGMCVCHRCDTPACVNTDHMFLGSNYDNVLDKVLKGRQHASPKRLQEQCKAGHEFDEANTYITSRGMRQCKRCRARRLREMRSRRRERSVEMSH
jgi:hypothetical protein